MRAYYGKSVGRAIECAFRGVVVVPLVLGLRASLSRIVETDKIGPLITSRDLTFDLT